MSARWIEKDVGPRTLRFILDAGKRNDDGSTSYSSLSEFFERNDLDPLINRAVGITSDISEAEKSRIIRKSINEMKSTGINDPNAFLKIIDKNVKPLIAKRDEIFYISTTISFQRSSIQPAFRINMDGVSIFIAPNFPKKILTGEWNLSGTGHINSSNPYTYACLHARTKAKTLFKATEKMLRSIDMLVAIMNFHNNFGKRHFRTGIENEPHNEIRLGEFQVAHYGNGKRHEDTVWYETEYVESKFLLYFTKTSPELVNFLKRWSKYIKKHPFSDVIKSALRQYKAALNQRDPHVTLLRLWSSLEILTDTTRSESKATVKRASAISLRRDVRMLKLANAAEVRNRYAHAGSEDYLIQQINQDLRIWVELLIDYMLFNTRSYLSHSEFVAVLDRANSLDELEKDISLAKKARKLLKPAPKAEES